MHRLVLLRHGESVWNKENLFTGWTDVDLSPEGIEESHIAAKRLKEAGFTFDIAVTSVLKRAIRTMWIVLDDMDLMWLPIYKDWRLNERHYGALQGLNKAQTALKYGPEQVLLWRRGFDIRPPELTEDDPRHPGHQRCYKRLNKKLLPVAESLKDTSQRFLPCWYELIAPAIQSGQNVLITAHGNSLRSLVKFLDNIDDNEILKLNIPTGIPLVYELDDDLEPLRHYYLADEQELKKSVEEVATQAAVTNENISGGKKNEL